MGAFLCVAVTRVVAQPVGPPPQQPDPLMQLMLTQPPIEISTNAEFKVEFDPPIVAVGEKAIYRVTINAVSDSVRWPDSIYAPMELTLKQSARGQILQPAVDKLRPITTINHHVTASKPGTYTIPEFRVKVYGQNVIVPAATLQVVSQSSPNLPKAQRLHLELTETNIYVGQPAKVRVYLPAGANNRVQTLSQVQINGDGVLVDQTSVRQRIQTMEFGGRTGPIFIYEASVTPLVAGRVDFTAQGYTANHFSGAITIQGQATIIGGSPTYVLLDSDPARIIVEPLPRTGELPGFTGAIGQFTVDPPQLSTNYVRVGDTLKLFVTFRTQGEIKRLNPPPPPALTNWQIFPPLVESGPILTATVNGVSSAITYSYTLVPLTNAMLKTPEIPFCYFDPRQGKYVDATIPSAPLTIDAGVATAAAQALAQAAAATQREGKLKLSGLAREPETSAASLMPLQMRSAFWFGQIVPFVGFAGLWLWDRRRRFYEAHPEVLVRKRARRALRRERAKLQQVARANDARRFVSVSVNALRIACAPHFPATPRALVGRDVLELFAESERNGRTGEVVRELFSAEDAELFSAAKSDGNRLLSLQPELNRILDQLEEKLK